MTRTAYRGYTVTTPYGTDENHQIYYVYRIYKAEPLTWLASEEVFAESDFALDMAKDYIDKHLVTLNKSKQSEIA